MTATNKPQNFPAIYVCSLITQQEYCNVKNVNQQTADHQTYTCALMEVIIKQFIIIKRIH